MILQRLAEFQETLEKVPSGYKEVFQTRRIRLTREGTLDGDPEGLTGQTQGSGKTLRHGAMFVVPREQPGRTGNARARLVHDDVDYVFGIAKGEGSDLEKVSERHRLYIDLLERAIESTGEPSLKAVLSFVRSGMPAELVASGKILPGDALHFMVDDIDPARVPIVETFWQAENAAYAKRNLKNSGDSEGFCLVTGDWTEVGQPMPEPIKGIPGGQMSGNMLVSVNFSAAESYGLPGNRGAPVAAPVSEAICKGLNHLTSDGNHHYRIGGDLYVYWVRGKAERDALAALKDPKADEELTAAARRMARRQAKEPVPDDIEKIFESFDTGKKAASISQANFHLLGLAANAARIMVRDSMEASLADVLSAQGRWLSRIELTGDDPPGLFAMAASLYREAKDVPKHVPVELLHAALNDRKPPPGLLSLAVGRNRVSGGPYALFNKKRIEARGRIALIKACLVDDPLDTTLNSLNLNHPSRAYHCGRLLFVLERIQERAIPGLKATVTSRHYGAASTTPGVVFGALVKDAVVAHLPKIGKTAKGLAVTMDRQLSEIMDAIGDEFPRTLDFEGQGLFSLGYYHQRSDAFRKKDSETADSEGAER